MCTQLTAKELLAASGSTGSLAVFTVFIQQSTAEYQITVNLRLHVVTFMTLFK